MPIEMTEIITASIVLVLVLLAVYILNRSRVSRRRALLGSVLAEQERAELLQDFSLLEHFPSELQPRLEGLIHLFIDEKSFEACGGIEEVTPRMQRLIAAQACLLLVGREGAWLPALRNILVYPDAFGFDERGVRLGESWSSGTVILSWASVATGAKNPEDGHDVSLHEFAHQLDQENSAGTGLPYLTSGGAYRNWSGVFSQSFETFCKRVEQGKKTVIDSYGATNPAEFFAVATETFFEKPKQFQARYPDLYITLQDYYQLDPLHWGRAE